MRNDQFTVLMDTKNWTFYTYEEFHVHEGKQLELGIFKSQKKKFGPWPMTWVNFFLQINL